MSRLPRSTTAVSAFGFALLCAVIPAGPVQADITGGALTIVATTPDGDEASFTIEAPAGASSWSWSSTQRMDLISAKSGNLIAILNPEERATSVEYVDDPVIGLSFNVQAGPLPVTVSISSALLSFPALVAEGRASAGFSLTDYDGDGAMLIGIGDPAGADGAYLAQYNGFAPFLLGTTFAEVIPSIAAGSYATTTVSADVPPLGFLTIVAPVSDMSVLISFRLSANDLASGTSVYVIQQRPTAVETVTWGRIKTLF